MSFDLLLSGFALPALVSQARTAPAFHISRAISPRTAADAGITLYESLLLDKTLREIAGLNADWDGYGAEPIDTLAMANTRAALETLKSQLPLPDIAPETNGTITLEWSADRGRAHLEIGSERFALRIVPRQGVPTFVDSEIAHWNLDHISAAILEQIYPRVYSKSLAISDFSFT
jgi:hypothetical protein